MYRAVASNVTRKNQNCNLIFCKRIRHILLWNQDMNISSLVTNMPCLAMRWGALCQVIVENEQTHTIIDVSSEAKTWYFKSNPRRKNQIPEPNSQTSSKSSIFKSYSLNLQKPDPTPQLINVLHQQEHIQYKMLIGRSKYIQVNIPWGEPQSYSRSIGYMSTGFRFMYSPRKIPGKRATNLFVYQVSDTTCLACYLRHLS